MLYLLNNICVFWSDGGTLAPLYFPETIEHRYVRLEGVTHTTSDICIIDGLNKINKSIIILDRTSRNSQCH